MTPATSPDDFPEVLTVKEAATALRCSEATMYKHVQGRDIPAVKCGGWRI